MVLPALWLEAREAAGGWDLNLGIGPIFADASYHDHFYGVASEFAAPQRPAYDGEGGYSGASILFGDTRPVLQVLAGRLRALRQSRWYGL
jgi:hypothetical protein